MTINEMKLTERLVALDVIPNAVKAVRLAIEGMSDDDFEESFDDISDAVISIVMGEIKSDDIAMKLASCVNMNDYIALLTTGIMVLASQNNVNDEKSEVAKNIKENYGKVKGE